MGGYIEALKSGDPDQANVYTVPEMTDASVGYVRQNSGDFAHTVFWDLPGMQTQQMKLRTYLPGAFRRNSMEKRKDGAQSAGGGFKTKTQDLFADVWSVHEDVGPQMRANATNVEVEMAIAEILANAYLLNREVQWAQVAWGVGIWATQFYFQTSGGGGSKTNPGTIGSPLLGWLDDTSDPIANMRAVLRAQRIAAAGIRANMAVIHEKVWERLLVHPNVRTLFNNGQTPGGPVMENPQTVKRQLANLLEINEVKVAASVVTTSSEGPDGTTETFDYTLPVGVGFYYKPPAPGKFTPAAGYFAPWTGYLGAGAQGQVITREKIPLTRGADRYEIEAAYEVAAVSTDMGAWLENVLV